MKVIIDDKIPYINNIAAQLFDEVIYLPGAKFGLSDQLADADALIVRTRTHCDRQLLANTRVRYIATATIGHDHINAADLSAMGIEWTNCPGCNATSVAQYVRNSLIVIAQRRHVELSSLTVGIVGYGHVGKAVGAALSQAGCRLLYNDPPLQEAHDTAATWSSLDQIAAQCDVVTFHTPLTHSGPHPTHHLADASFFGQLQRRPVIINAARGGVVDEAALLQAYADGLVSDLVIDTWEHEPHINTTLLQRALIATPHIAGYSADGKSNATRMSLRAVCQHFGIAIADPHTFMALTAPPALPPTLRPTGHSHTDALALYNPLHDTERLTAAFAHAADPTAGPAAFERLRGDYPLRRESFE